MLLYTVHNINVYTAWRHEQYLTLHVKNRKIQIKRYYINYLITDEEELKGLYMMKASLKGYSKPQLRCSYRGYRGSSHTRALMPKGRPSAI